MTRDEFVAILSPLLLGMRTEFDRPTWKVYFMAMRDVHPALLEAAVATMLRESLAFFPKVGELRARAEKHRRQQLALHPHEACCDCEMSKGWRFVVRDGVSRAERCPCLARHQAKLQSMGLLEAVAPLPGEAERESEQVFPTLEQLPADVRQRLGEVAGQKVLR